jgi:hypothetical protein
MFSASMIEEEEEKEEKDDMDDADGDDFSNCNDVLELI